MVFELWGVLKFVVACFIGLWAVNLFVVGVRILWSRDYSDYEQRRAVTKKLSSTIKAN